MKKTFLTLGITLALGFAITVVPANAQGQTLLDQLEAIFTVTDTQLQVETTVDVPALTIGDHVITTTDDGSLCIGACDIETAPVNSGSLTWAVAVTDIQSGLEEYYAENTSYPATLEYYPQNDADSVFSNWLDNLALDNSSTDILATIPESIETMIVYGYQNDVSQVRCPDQGVNSYAITFDANSDLTEVSEFEYNTAGSWHFYCATGTDNA